MFKKKLVRKEIDGADVEGIFLEIIDGDFDRDEKIFFESWNFKEPYKRRAYEVTIKTFTEDA